MKAYERLSLLIGVFALVLMVVYTQWTANTALGREWVGTVGFTLVGLFGLMNAWYLWMTRRKLEADPADDPDGRIDEIQGDYGFFSPYSWWPLILAFASAVMFLGLAVGWWMFAIGLFLAVPALIGWTFEYYKGPHAL